MNHSLILSSCASCLLFVKIFFFCLLSITSSTHTFYNTKWKICLFYCNSCKTDIFKITDFGTHGMSFVWLFFTSLLEEKKSMLQLSHIFIQLLTTRCRTPFYSATKRPKTWLIIIIDSGFVQTFEGSLTDNGYGKWIKGWI